MSPSPKVSVILPTYNRAELLKRAIDSVLSQTYTDFELIIVDDASTDDTCSVVNDICDKRIKYIKHSENKGASAARNTGISNADGEYIAFQNSDDVWHKEKLEAHMDAFETAPPNIGVVYCGMKVVNDVNNEEERVPPQSLKKKHGDISEQLQEFNFISDQMAVVRKTCFDELGQLREGLAPLDDWELWIRLSKKYAFRHVDEVLVTAYISDNSISQDTRALVEARKRIIESHNDFFDRTALARQQFFVGHGCCKIGEINIGRKYLLKSVLSRPNRRNLPTVLLSFLGQQAYSTVYQLIK